MINLGKAFRITNKNLILTTPQILYIILSGLFLKLSGTADIKGLIFTVVIFIFMTGAFLSGWFSMIKESINSFDKNDIEPYNLLKFFPLGVGDKFVTYTSATVLFFIVFIAVVIGAYQTALHFIGELGISPNDLNSAMASAEQLKLFLNSLSLEQIIKINQWNLLFLIFISIYAFVTMLWVPEIAYGESNNVFKLLWRSVKKLFKTFFKSLILFSFALLMYIIVSLITAFSGVNGIIYFISVLLSVYSTVYLVVLLFVYYDEEFRSDSDSGADSQRKD